MVWIVLPLFISLSIFKEFKGLFNFSEFVLNTILRFVGNNFIPKYSLVEYEPLFYYRVILLGREVSMVLCVNKYILKSLRASCILIDTYLRIQGELCKDRSIIGEHIVRE